MGGRKLYVEVKPTWRWRGGWRWINNRRQNINKEGAWKDESAATGLCDTSFWITALFCTFQIVFPPSHVINPNLGGGLKYPPVIGLEKTVMLVTVTNSILVWLQFTELHWPFQTKSSFYPCEECWTIFPAVYLTGLAVVVLSLSCRFLLVLLWSSAICSFDYLQTLSFHPQLISDLLHHWRLTSCYWVSLSVLTVTIRYN